MFFVIEASGPAEAMQAIPPGTLRSATIVTDVKEAYKFPTGAQ